MNTFKEINQSKDPLTNFNQNLFSTKFLGSKSLQNLPHIGCNSISSTNNSESISKYPTTSLKHITASSFKNVPNINLEMITNSTNINNYGLGASNGNSNVPKLSNILSNSTRSINLDSTRDSEYKKEKIEVMSDSQVALLYKKLKNKRDNYNVSY